MLAPYAMEAIFKEVQEHLQQVTQDPAKPVDSRVLEKLDSHIIEDLPSVRRRMLVNQLATLLPALQQDPTSVAELATALIDSDDTLVFSDVLTLKPEVNFIGGLKAPIPALNKVTLALLQKAKSVADAGLVAGKPELVSALVELWLRTPQTTVAEKSRAVIEGLLAAEPPGVHEGDASSTPPSQGLMWRRMFNDKDVYGLFYSLCSVSTVGQPDQLSRREKTIAQGRLLDLVQAIHYAPQIWKSQMPDIEKLYGVSAGHGLLEFAVVKMVDYKDDVLIHMTLVDFFTRLISRTNGDILSLNSSRSAGISPHSSGALDFLISTGVHQRTISYFLDPDQHDSLDVTYLYSSATHYIATYARHYTTHFLHSTARAVISRLTEVVTHIPSNAWAGSSLTPVHDLKLLSTIPQRALFSLDRGALLLSMPTKPTNVDALHALGAIFKGPTSPSNAEDIEIIVPPPSEPSRQGRPDLTAPDRMATRALFFLYVQDRPQFFRNVVAAAEMVAIKDQALAAVGLLHAIADANWDALPSSATHELPSETQLENQCSTYPRPLPAQGVLALLQPPAIQHVMPYLMRGPENSSETAWEVAVAKHAVVGIMARRLRAVLAEEEGEESEHWREILGAVERRDAEGPSGRTGGETGRRGIPVVGTIGN